LILGTELNSIYKNIHNYNEYNEMTLPHSFPTRQPQQALEPHQRWTRALNESGKLHWATRPTIVQKMAERRRKRWAAAAAANKAHEATPTLVRQNAVRDTASIWSVREQQHHHGKNITPLGYSRPGWHLMSVVDAQLIVDKQIEIAGFSYNNRTGKALFHSEIIDDHSVIRGSCVAKGRVSGKNNWKWYDLYIIQ
jgi:hypothetical protein